MTHSLLLAALLLVLTPEGFAQGAAAKSPDRVVKDLYQARETGEGDPFFQAKDRALVDTYFTTELGDLIWNDAVAADGEVGALSFDPVYYSQDPEATDLAISNPTFPHGPEAALVSATFQSAGKPERVQYELLQQEDGSWKIHSITYSDGENLGSILKAGLDRDTQAEASNEPTFAICCRRIRD